jgi:hypothetical protein
MSPRIRGLSIAALFLAGCQDPADEPPAPAPPPAVARTTGVPSLDSTEATDEAIFAWLEAERYRETWELLPGTLPLHPGTEPHGTLLTAYADPRAMEAIERGAPSMPAGAAIVAEDYLVDSTLSSISVMMRVGDSGPDSAEWRFARFGSAGEIEAGPMDACRSCHVQEPDLVFGWELGSSLPIDSTGATPAGSPAAGPGGRR